MVRLYTFMAYIGAAIAACIGVMYGLSFLSVAGYAVLGAHVGIIILAVAVYVVRS